MSRARLGVGRLDEHQLLQPARAQQRRVDQVRAVGRAEHHDVAQRLDAVEFGQQRGHHPVGHPGVEALPAPRRQRVDLVEEHQRRRGIACPAEQFAHRLLRGAHPLVHQLGALDGVHADSRPELASARTTNVLPQPGRAVEQHTARRVDPEPGEGVGMLQRPQHRLGERLLGVDHVADVVEGHRADRHLLGGRARQRPDDGQRADEVLLGQRRAACRPRWPAPPPAAPPRAPAPPDRRRTKPGVRSAISSSLSSSAGTSRSSTSSSALRVAPSGRLRPSSRSHRSGARSRGSSASGCCEVATNATPGAATALRSSARISVATGSAGVGQQRVDVGDQQHAAAVADGRDGVGDGAASRSSARQRADVRAVEFDQPTARAHRPHQRGLADAGRSGDQHAEIRFGAKLFQQGGLVEGQLEPLGEPARPARADP